MRHYLAPGNTAVGFLAPASLAPLPPRGSLSNSHPQLMNYFATRLEMHELEILHMLEDFAISIKYAIHLAGN